ncbi:MAG: beta-propeller fold lactonase family protein [Candidatus Sulfotelmatobacter sp.]
MRSVTPSLVIFCVFVFNCFVLPSAQGATAAAKPRFVYVANNQDGSVSVFEVDNFMLRARDYVYESGSSPLSVALTPSQKFLYVGGNGSPGLSCYGVNAESGQLTFLSSASSVTSLFQLQVDPSGKFLLLVDGNAVQSYRINNETGALSLAGFASGGSPTALVIHPSGKFVYGISEQKNAIIAFHLNSTTGALTKIAGSPFLTHSQNPWAATIDPNGNYLFVPNANGANVSVFAIDSGTGAVTQVPGSPFSAGAVPYTAVVAPSGKFLYVGNAYDRTISTYAINPASGGLTPVSGSPFSTGLSGPLGLSIDPTGSVLYSMDHDSEEVVIFSISGLTGSLTLENTVRSRGAAISMAIVSGTTSATYLPKSVYVANAGSNNISAFSIAEMSGVLSPITGSPFAAGALPNATSSDTYGRFLFVSNGGDSTVSAFIVNAVSGALTAVSGSPFVSGRQPTSVVVDSGAHFVYATNNLDNTISGFSISTSGMLTALDGFPISTAPLMGPIALAIDPRGKLLYVVNADSNSVTSYSIDAGNGSLTNMGFQSTGSSPNSLTVDPTGRYVLVSDSGSSDVYVYAIDGPTGALTQAAVSPSSGLDSPSTVAADPSGKRAYVGNGNPSDLVGYWLNTSTGVLKQLPNSPFVGVTGPFSLSFDLSGGFLFVANNSGNTVSGYAVNRTNGALSAVPGTPFSAGSVPTAATVVDSVRR